MSDPQETTRKPVLPKPPSRSSIRLSSSPKVTPLENIPIKIESPPQIQKEVKPEAAIVNEPIVSQITPVVVQSLPAIKEPAGAQIQKSVAEVPAQVEQVPQPAQLDIQPTPEIEPIGKLTHQGSGSKLSIKVPPSSPLAAPTPSTTPTHIMPDTPTFNQIPAPAATLELLQQRSAAEAKSNVDKKLVLAKLKKLDDLMEELELDFTEVMVSESWDPIRTIVKD